MPTLYKDHSGPRLHGNSQFANKRDRAGQQRSNPRRAQMVDQPWDFKMMICTRATTACKLDKCRRRNPCSNPLNALPLQGPPRSLRKPCPPIAHHPSLIIRPFTSSSPGPSSDLPGFVICHRSRRRVPLPLTVNQTLSSRAGPALSTAGFGTCVVPFHVSLPILSGFNQGQQGTTVQRENPHLGTSGNKFNFHYNQVQPGTAARPNSPIRSFNLDHKYPGSFASQYRTGLAIAC